MANFLFKKSYKLSNFKKTTYDHLWGSTGVFTTIRLFGKEPKFVLLDEHIFKLNKSLKKLNIPFSLTRNKLFDLMPHNLRIKKYDHLLRVAIKKNIISLSLRPRLPPKKNFQCTLINYQRSNPSIKNLQYKKILSLQKGIDMQKEEILFVHNKNLLEGSTTNLIVIKNNNIFLPKGNFYRGITLEFLLSKIGEDYRNKFIKFADLESADEIILVGSGKGVINVSSIPSIKWFSSSSKMFNRLLAIYKEQLK